MGHNAWFKPRNINDEVLIEKMNLTADYIYNRVGYDDIVRIYKFFINNPDKSKRYLYDDSSNDNLNRRTKDHIWRNYKKDARSKAMSSLGELHIENVRMLYSHVNTNAHGV
jgi:hypothetical protein